MDAEKTSRRYFLRTAGLVGLSALAGCAGSNDAGDPETTTDQSGSTDSGDDGESPSGDSGDSTTGDDGSGDPIPRPGSCTPGHTEGGPPCQQIADDASTLVRYDASGTDLLVSFQYPCGWQTSTTDQFEDRFQANTSRYQIGSGDSQTFVDIQIRVSTEAVTADYVQSQTAEGSYDDVEYQYDGETRTAAVTAQSGDFDEQYGANAYTTVPYDGSLYAVDVVPTVQGELCGAEVDDLVVAIVKSLDPNPETTFTPA